MNNGAYPRNTRDERQEIMWSTLVLTASLIFGQAADGKDDAKDEKKDDKSKDDKSKTLPKLKSAEPTYRISFGKHVVEAGRELVVVKRETKRKTGDKTAYDVAFAKVLVDAGINVQFRERKGDRIQAACGQLRRERHETCDQVSDARCIVHVLRRGAPFDRHVQCVRAHVNSDETHGSLLYRAV